jgi:hypothetical protein
MRSLKNTKSSSSAIRLRRPPERPLFGLVRLLLIALTAGCLSSCEPTYPARTLTTTLPRVIKSEMGFDVTAQVVGKTLWVYFPCSNLVDPEKMTWNTSGLESIGKVMSVVHRVALSTDAKIDFLVTVGADNKHFGLEFIAIEYIPDLKEAMVERFSRGEYFLRSVREINQNPNSLKDPTGATRRYTDVTFDEFIGLQILHRAKNYFIKDKKLSEVYEIKTSAWSQKFGIFKINVEFAKKRYDLTPEQAKIKPVNILAMIAAQVMKTYNYYDKCQAVELTDTFSDETVRLSAGELKKLKIDLPKLID